MANPNTTFQRFAARRWVLVVREDCRGPSHAEERRDALKLLHVGCMVRVRSYRLGRRNNPVLRFYVAVYRDGAVEPTNGS